MKNNLICEVTVEQDRTWVNFYKQEKETLHPEWINSKNYGWFK
jgi:hypothetical protein